MNAESIKFTIRIKETVISNYDTSEGFALQPQILRAHEVMGK